MKIVRVLTVLFLLATLGVGVRYVLRLIEQRNRAVQLAKEATVLAVRLDSIRKIETDSIERVVKAREDSIAGLEIAASSSRRRFNALSHTIDSLVAADSGGVTHLPADATALDSARAQAMFWKDRYEERTVAATLAAQEADSLRLANMILHREVFDVRRLYEQADSSAKAWKASSTLWQKVAECRIPVIGVGCPSRTMVGVSAVLGGYFASR